MTKVNIVVDSHIYLFGSVGPGLTKSNMGNILAIFLFFYFTLHNPTCWTNIWAFTQVVHPAARHASDVYRGGCTSGTLWRLSNSEPGRYFGCKIKCKQSKQLYFLLYFSLRFLVFVLLLLLLEYRIRAAGRKWNVSLPCWRQLLPLHLLNHYNQIYCRHCEGKVEIRLNESYDLMVRRKCMSALDKVGINSLLETGPP